MLAACALASSYACIRSSLLSVLVAAGLVCHKNECERNLAAFAQFLTDPREATLIGLAILKQGGLTPGAPAAVYQKRVQTWLLATFHRVKDASLIDRKQGGPASEEFAAASLCSLQGTVR